MKRITLILVTALLVAVAGLAIGQQKVIKLKGLETKSLTTEQKTKAPKKASLQRQADLDKKASARLALAKAQKGKSAKARKAVGDLLITNQPKGDLVSYVRSGDATYVFWGAYVFNTSVVGAASDVVFGSNNTVYIKNLLSQFTCNSWTKGTIDGNTIKIEFPQPAFYSDGEELDLFLANTDAEGNLSVEESATLTLDYNPETGDITTPEGSDFATGTQLIAFCWFDGSWTGYSDWNITLKKQTDEPVTAPEGLTTETYSLAADGYAGSLVNVGFDGDDVYVQGIYSGLPDAWVKGTISGDKVIFKSGQYLGATDYHQYLVSATAEELYDDYYEEYYTEYTLSDGDIEFEYDAATKTLTNSTTFLINAGKDDVSYAAAFQAAKIAPFTEVAATPAAPSDISVEEMDYAYFTYGYGWGYLTFNLNTQDVDGNFILPEKLSYVIWTRVEGKEEVYELTPDLWVKIGDYMTEIPYDFTDNYDFSYNGASHSFYYFMTGFDAIGLQAIYRGAGEERKSDITWYEMETEPQPAKETPTYPEVDPANTGSSIIFSLADGETSPTQYGENTPETYDVAIKLQDASLTGTHIDKISFPLLSQEGVKDVKVWLSTNLRVEDGKNAPNLIEIPVDWEKAQAGYDDNGIVAVELDKPYTIPAEGVYVGYSITVENTSIEENQQPILVLPYATEGGFYIHSSKVYLKWLDKSAEFGLTAYILVGVSGQSVKADAAGVKANAIQYVKTGEAFKVQTALVNHGGNGITSADVDYTINGTTTSKHFDLEDPVGGLFGVGETVTAELPAIAERGNYDLTVKVTKVNGVDNEDAAAEVTNQIVVLNTVPKHRPLLEEYTGLWCGYCPRGYVGLQKLAELYPDEYVLVSYHNSDDMEVLVSNSSVDEFPSSIAGFPSALIDRVVNVDAYYGYDEDYGVEPLGVVKPLNERAEVFGQADIALTASLDAEKNAIDVNTTVTFPYDIDDNKYALEYVLVADGLSDESWGQSNYYSGELADDENFKVFTEGDSYVYGLVFNDVAVQVSAPNGIAIDGSLPETVKADEAIEHKYTFNLDEALNSAGAPVIQNGNKLRVVAILVNTETGEVVNANKVEVGTYVSTGIETLKDQKISGIETERYNAAGQRISAPQKGLNIIKLSNGRTLKVIVK